MLSPHAKKGDVGCAEWQLSTTAALRLLGEAVGMTHNNDSCSLSDTSLVWSAMLSVSPTEELKTGSCAARHLGLKFHFLLCPWVSNFTSLGLSFPVCKVA